MDGESAAGGRPIGEQRATGATSEVAPRAGAPSARLRTRDVVALIVGIVVGAGIFRAPSVVAANTSSTTEMLALWVVGGLISLAGAVTWAELATTYPDAGGEYHFLRRAFGRHIGFLYAWTRLTIVPTGSIALLAFVFGDYATRLVPLGPGSSAIYALAAVGSLTALNLAGIRHGTRTQNALTVIEVAGIAMISAVGMLVAGGLAGEAIAAPATSAAATAAGGGAAPAGSIGLAMIFVLLTFGGWNEAAYVSAEVRGSRRAIVRSLVAGVLFVSLLYLFANVSYVLVLGREGMAGSDAIAADVLARVIGPAGVVVMSVLVAFAALTSANATILFGARSNYALGRDYSLFSALGRWREGGGTPPTALLVQGVVAGLLVLLGSTRRSGFEALVEWTAPVFWLFFLLTGLSLFVLRARDPGATRHFRVPLYPLTPAIFCVASAWLFWSSLRHAGEGAIAGTIVLLAGVLLLPICDRRPGSRVSKP